MTGIATVSTAQTAQNQGTTASDTKKASLDYDAFLKLMIAQLQNQDPLNPMDGSAYVSQLASFSSVEQGLKTNAKLDQLLVMSNIAQASGAVGLHVTAADGSASGVISSVKVDDTGATAILEDGSTVLLTSGVIFGANV